MLARLVRSMMPALAVAVLLAPGAARADPAVADQLFKQAKELLQEGKITEACRRFQESYETDPALGALMNLADCLERDGRIATAYGRWGEAIELAGRKDDERLAFARTRRDALKPKLSFVTVEVVGSGEGLDVYRGNTKLSSGAYNVPLPTDPGQTVIQVVRGDEVLWERKIVLNEAARATVSVDLGEIARVKPPPMKKRVDQKEGGATGTAGETSFWNAQRVAGLAVMGVGLAGAAVGFTLGGLAASEGGDIDAECTEGETRFCTEDGRKAIESAKTYADASTWTLVASGVVAAVGLTVFVTAPSAASELEDRAGVPRRVAVSPWLPPGGGGLVVGGEF